MKCDSIFRIWVYKDKIMLPCSSIYFLQGGTQVEDACTFEGWCQVDDDYKDEIEVDCDLMQYIDVIDNNGYKIYENDIVRCYGGESAQGYYEHDDIIIIDSITNWQTIGLVSESDNVEVIGNIYENPELLKMCSNNK